MNNNKKSKRTLLLLLIVFVGPLLVATVMFAMRGQWSLTNPISHGQLIHPAQPIIRFAAKVSVEQEIGKDYLQGKWTYFLYLPAICDLECEAALFKMRQTRLAVGKDINRVQYAVLSQPEITYAIDGAILNRHQRLVVADLVDWDTQESGPQQEQLQAGFVYLVDPLGNLMMRYDMSSTSKGMLKDIKKLLRTSNVG